MLLLVRVKNKVRSREAQERRSFRDGDKSPRLLSLRMRLHLSTPLPLPSRDAIVTSRGRSLLSEQSRRNYLTYISTCLGRWVPTSVPR